jgi:hypothetical protein
MTLESIVQSELTAEEREGLEQDRLRWRAMGAGAHLDAWLKFGPGLLALRRVAMRLVHANAPKGKRYNKQFTELLQHFGLHTMPATTALLWLHEDEQRLAVLAEVRAALTTPGERARFNSPITAKQHVVKRLEARARAEERARGKRARATAPRLTAGALKGREYRISAHDYRS